MVNRIHFEGGWLPFFAAAAMSLTSLALNRTGTIRGLTSPFNNFGRPALRPVFRSPNEIFPSLAALLFFRIKTTPKSNN